MHVSVWTFVAGNKGEDDEEEGGEEDAVAAASTQPCVCIWWLSSLTFIHLTGKAFRMPSLHLIIPT